MSTAGLGVWVGVCVHGVCLLRDQAAQGVLENTMSQSGRISAAAGRGNLVAQMLFGGQQCFVTSGPAPIATCVSSIYCSSCQYLARIRSSQPTGSGARCRNAQIILHSAQMQKCLSLDLKNDAIPLFQHRTMACPGDGRTVQGCGGPMAEQMG